MAVPTAARCASPDYRDRAIAHACAGVDRAHSRLKGRGFLPLDGGVASVGNLPVSLPPP